MPPAWPNGGLCKLVLSPIRKLVWLKTLNASARNWRVIWSDNLNILKSDTSAAQ